MCVLHVMFFMLAYSLYRLKLKLTNQKYAHHTRVINSAISQLQQSAR